MREIAHRALARTAPADDRTRTALRKALEDADAHVRWQAARLLVEVAAEQAEPALPLLREAIYEAKDEVRLRAAIALRKVRPEEARLFEPVFHDAYTKGMWKVTAPWSASRGKKAVFDEAWPRGMWSLGLEAAQALGPLTKEDALQACAMLRAILEHKQQRFVGEQDTYLSQVEAARLLVRLSPADEPRAVARLTELWKGRYPIGGRLWILGEWRLRIEQLWKEFDPKGAAAVGVR